jgi:hypothetical protein
VFYNASQGFDQVVAFDGALTRLEAPDAASLDITGDLTLVAWVRTTTAGQEAIVGKWNGSTVQRAYVMYIDGGNLKCVVSDDNAFNAAYQANGGAINDGLWHSVALVFDAGTSVEAFIDGVSSATASSAPASIISNTAPFRIGAFDDLAASILDGHVGEVRLYNATKSAAELLAIKNGTDDTTNLVSKWRLIEGGGTTVVDSTGSNDAAFTAGSGFWDHLVPAKAGDASLLGGTVNHPGDGVGHWQGEALVAGNNWFDDLGGLTDYSRHRTSGTIEIYADRFVTFAGALSAADDALMDAYVADAAV